LGIHIRDYFGVYDIFKVIETGKAPEGYGRKVSVTSLNSRGNNEKAIVNPDHIQIHFKKEKPTKVKDKDDSDKR
jgi:hypothetical protein